MKRFSRILVCAGLFLSITAVPLTAYQATNTTTTNSTSVLIPCGYDADPNVAAKSCDFKKLIDLMNNVINILVIITAPLATIAFVWIGIMLLTAQDNPNKRTEAKAIAKKVIIGFVIVLSAWLVIHVIAAAVIDPRYNIFMKQ
jgi:heme/copper-type cytochrome/quinol oxidase subunit 2